MAQMIRTTSFSGPRWFFLNEAEARKAATTVVKTSDAVVKFGRTNGHICLHIKLNKASNTIYNLAEWANHPWNKTNKPKEKAPEEGILDAVRND